MQSLLAFFKVLVKLTLGRIVPTSLKEDWLQKQTSEESDQLIKRTMSDNKSIVLPTFNGKDEAFQVWWTKFCAFATAKGFAAMLLGKEADLPTKKDEVLDLTADADKVKIKAKKCNGLGMVHLLQAFNAEANVSLACETVDNDWPGGLSHSTVQKLMAICKPKDNVMEVEVHSKLLHVKMKKKEDPKVLFEHVASIQNWCNTDKKKLPKEQLIAVVCELHQTSAHLC